MSPQAWIMLALLVGMFGLLIWGRLPTWMVFMGVFTVAFTLRLAPQGDMLRGFSNSGVLTVAALYPVAAGMYATGAITLLSQRFIGFPQSLRPAQWRILTPVAVGSAFLNNTPLVAMMVPVVRDITRLTGLDGSKLFMFVSFASILGGAATLIGTSTNLIIAGLVNDAIVAGQLPGMQPITIFQPTLVGGPVAIVGVLFLIYIGTRLLRERKVIAETGGTQRLFQSEFRVESGSPLAGKTLEQAGLARSADFQIQSIIRADGSSVPVEAATTLEGDDRLSMVASADAVPGLWMTIGLVPVISREAAGPQARSAQYLLAGVVAPTAPMVGQRVGSVSADENPVGGELVAVGRPGVTPSEPLADWQIEAGDTLILALPETLPLQHDLDSVFSLTRRLRGFRVPRIDRAAIATVITLAMILLAAFNIMTMLNAALLAGLAMLLTGCLTPKRAFGSLEWETIVVLGAAVGLAEPITTTGLADVLAGLLGVVGARSSLFALLAVFVGCVVMTNVITNAAAASFMFPVALALAAALGLNFMPFVIILMLGTSYAFINPAGFQTNLMVQEPGGYSFGDFVRVGLPLTLVVGILAVALTLIVYPP